MNTYLKMLVYISLERTSNAIYWKDPRKSVGKLFELVIESSKEEGQKVGSQKSRCIL